MASFSIWRPALVFLVLSCVATTQSHRHRQYHGQRHDFPQSPVELMVDLTNNLGFRILYHHSVGNRNNIALSPCGLSSVLVALFEGSDGSSAIQIHKAMQLPWDRDLVRIGFRDIHRRLRSYFYSQDNLLSGLSLSEPNVTVRPEYENILRFYGYDLDNGNMITSNGKACKTNETEEQTTVSPPPETTTPTMDEEMETTMIPTTTEETQPTESSATADVTTTLSTSTAETTQVPETSTTEEPAAETSTMPEARTTKYIYKFKPPKTTTVHAEADELKAIETTTSEAATEVPSSVDSTDLNALKRRRRRKNRTFNRWKRSPLPLHYLLLDEEDHELHQPGLFLNPGTPQPQYSISDYVVPQPSFNLRDSLNETPMHEDVITHLFYLNRQDTINVPFKVFNSIMKYGYFSSIQSSVLEVDLDSKNYSLLILLPDWLDFGLEGLITTMKSPYSPHLREIRAALQPTWVKAIIPKFYLTGHIVLTADLQNVRID